METVRNMILSGAVAMVLLLLLGPTPGTNALTSPVCETSAASGLTSDCTNVGFFLKSLGDTPCGNGNGVASKCTNMKTIGTCTAAICGDVASQPCSTVADYVNTLSTNCASTINGNSHSGGTQIMNENGGLKVEIF
ncbi:hypothetical protein M758_1G261600 [Ceratodon purpureus]|uniref:Uncharacterized protein n=1 Tax=Ceratodon purpureus TaxID=3225 RepID=A0A8T0JA60_CERPU|nr:hypothetical protein KC19_1G269300 [Ceratodon purpureus]KAG0631550.1 hypothetical protein M758_1G261600 [Ceratodon purpureus]